MYRIISVFIISAFVVSCASTWPPAKFSPFYTLSDDYDENIQQDIIILDVIDARSNRDTEFKNIDGYKILFKRHILNLLTKDKNYKMKIISADTSSCPSVSQMTDLSCLFDKSIFDKRFDLILLLSIDEFIPPHTLKQTSKTVVSGGLFSIKLNSFIWKDKKINNSDYRNFEFLGPLALGPFLAYSFRNAIASNDTICRDSTIITMKMMLQDIPPYVNGDKYEGQINVSNNKNQKQY